MMTVFMTTKKGAELYAEVESLEKAKAELDAKVMAEYKAELKAVDMTASNKDTVISEIVTKRFKKQDEIYKKMHPQIQVAKNNYELAEKTFLEELAKDNAWSDVSKRKSVPFILSELVKSDKTESELELAINGKLSESAKQSRYGFPIKHLEILGWITRTGSGNSGDAMVSHITELGKEQSEFYSKYGMFKAPEL